MLRNQMLDPESSPSKAERARFAPPSPSGSDRSDQEDEWYSAGNAGNSNSSSSGAVGPSTFAPGLNYRGGNANVGGYHHAAPPRFGGGVAGYGDGGFGHGDSIGGGPMGGRMGGYGDNDDDEDNDDVPLLEELGINFDHIWRKTLTVLYPNRRIPDEIADDTDLAGPVCFALLLGSCLLLKGKVHFGYVYGFSVFGSTLFNSVLNLLHHKPLTFWLTASVLGYSLLPVALLAAISIVLSMRGLLGMLLSIAAVGWSSFSAIRMLDARLKLLDQWWLVVYPLVLLYSCFTLLAIF